MSGSHHHHRDSGGSNLKVAFTLNVAFTVLEVFGGIWTNSIAILADAVHDSGDCLSLGLAWYLQRLAQRRPDGIFTYGYRRLSNVGALTTGVVLIIGLTFIAWHAAGRLRQPEEVHTGGMMGLALLGITFNGFAAWKLHGGGSLNEQVASWHMIEDVLGWVAVLVGSAVMTFWHVPVVDPLLSLGISAFVLWNVIRNLRKVAMVFLQTAPEGFDVARFEAAIAQAPKVLSSHHTHGWSLDGQHHVFSTHLVMQRGANRADILAAKRRAVELLGADTFIHITIEVELEDELCSEQARR